MDPGTESEAYLKTPKTHFFYQNDCRLEIIEGKKRVDKFEMRGGHSDQNSENISKIYWGVTREIPVRNITM